MKRAQNFDFIQDTLSVFLFLERATRENDFSKDMQGNIDAKRKRKGTKNNVKGLLLLCNNIAFRF